MKNEHIIIVGVSISIVTIIVLAILLSRKHNSENYKKCICTGSQGGRGRVCQNTETAWKNYQNGLTEYADIVKMQKDMGGPKWSTVSPGDYDFPLSEGCPWNYKPKHD